MSQTLKEMELEFESVERWTHEEMATKMNMIHNIDCLDFMKKVPDGYFDLVLTDPPYGINISSNPIRQKHSKKDWDSEAPSQDFFDEMKRISKHQIIWGANYFNLPPSKCFLVWDKKQPYDFSLAMAELAYCSIDYPAKIYSHSNRGDQEKMHPSQKPSKLMEFCINFARERFEVKSVFDPFMGSGTTAVASKECAINWCGCELEPDYVEIANKRLSKVQTSIFAFGV